MLDELSIEVLKVSWESDRDQLIAVRETVFVREQNVSRDIELDGSDEGCVHVLARLKNGTAVGTARLDSEGHVGRVAVLAAFRRRGIGRLLMVAIEEEAREKGFRRVVLNSQTHASKFYARLGYVAEGNEFLEAGIPHVKMAKSI